MAEVVCFWTEPIAKGQLSLRRYVERDALACDKSPYGYCNASAAIGDVDMPAPQHGVADPLAPNNDFSDDDRWPKACPYCGRVFGVGDHWQVNLHRYYARSDGPGTAPENDAEAWIIRDLPPGAMYDAWWMGWKGEDGISLCVMLPEPDRYGGWCVDGPAGNAPGKLPGWERTGVPPKVTANPSIKATTYHGYLRDGVLVD